MYAKAFALLTIVSLVQGGVAPAGVAYANYAIEGPHIGAQSEQTVRGFGGFSTVSKQQKAIVGPHSAVTKHDTRITNDGVGIAYSQAIAPAYHHAAYPVAHAAPVAAVAPLGHHYAHHAPAIAPAYAHHAYAPAPYAPAPIAAYAPAPVAAYAHHPYAHHAAPVAVAAPVVKTALPIAAAPVQAAYATHVKSAAPVYAQHHPVSYAAHPYQHYAHHAPLVAAAPIAKIHAPVSYAAPVAAVAKVHASPLGYSLITPNVFSLNFEGHGIKYHY